MLTASRSFFSYWVAALALLVFSMIVIGGLTRLTESGLSIVEWKLVSGILPPLTEEGWQKEFEAYRQSPQYQQVNKGMSVADFKNIFWLEYLHRLLGRTIGLVALLPLVIISLRKIIPSPVYGGGLGRGNTAPENSPHPVSSTGQALAPPRKQGEEYNWFLPRMWLVASLIGLQGAIGWYMVKSGLIDVPWVSPYRLALHLGLAMGILLLLTNTWMRLKNTHLSVVSQIAVSVIPAKAGIFPFQAIKIPAPEFIPAQAGTGMTANRDTTHLSSASTLFQTRFSLIVVIAVFIQILLGAFVAGLDAGLTYNTFPLMDGDLVPSGLWTIEPAWRNLFENITMVNFLHRWFAFITGMLVIFQGLWLLRAGSPPFLKRWGIISIALTILQIALGISTLLMVVPVHLATAHQAIAALLLISVNIIAYLSWQSMPKQMQTPTLSVTVAYAEQPGNFAPKERDCRAEGSVNPNHVLS